jgi:hypothetical protein
LARQTEALGERSDGCDLGICLGPQAMVDGQYQQIRLLGVGFAPFT